MTQAPDQVIFGFLTTIDSPLLPHYLAAAQANHVKNIHVLFDSKLITEKDQCIWRERTGGFFDAAAPTNPSLYDLGNLQIPFYFVDSQNRDVSLSLIKNLKINCLFNAGTPRRLSAALLGSVKHGVLNVHPGLLPAYRGCSAVEWAIYNNDKVGNTAHFMSEGYDTGPVIESEWYEFGKDSDYQSIRNKVYQAGCSLAGKVLSRIQNTRITPGDARVQDEVTAQYWNPIPDATMSEVLQKISARAYKFQRL
jgi:folate-dependent phosphoribosylglycinamide formyltransferase PurN